MDYMQWRKQMAERRRVCLACETEEWLSKASAEELEASQPCADNHEGPYCKERKHGIY